VKLLEGENISLKRRILAVMGEQEFRVERVRTESGVRRRYYVWTQKHIDCLTNIAHPDSGPEETALITRGGIEFGKTISDAGTLVSGPT